MTPSRGTFTPSSSSSSSSFSASYKRRRKCTKGDRTATATPKTAPVAFALLSVLWHQSRPFLLFVEGVPLLGGLYNTTTTDAVKGAMIGGILGLSLDLQDMRSTDSVQEKQDHYMNGRNVHRAYPMDDAGFWAPLTLSSLSLYLTAEMRDDPLFNVYKHGFDRLAQVDDGTPQQGNPPAVFMTDRDDYGDLDLQEDEDEVGSFGGYPVEEYAHTLVMNALYRYEQRTVGGADTDTIGGASSSSGSNSSSSRANATAAAREGVLPVEDVILTTMVWMAVAHELHEVVRLCGDESNAAKGLDALDRAASLWMGSAEGGGGMLYQLTEEAGSSFGRLGAGGEEEKGRWVNRELLEGWNDIQRNLLTTPGKCSGNDPFIATLREEIYRSINYMTIPLVQNLILSIVGTKGNGSLPELAGFDEYFSAVIPQVMACDPNLARELYLPYSIDAMNETAKKAWVHTLEKTYDCFRLSCGDIGTYRDDIQGCQDVGTPTTNSTSLTLAGYGATAPVTRSISRIDRDILQLSIFLSYGSFASAKEWYWYGYNSVHTLRTLALGDAVPNEGTLKSSQFELYQDYHTSTNSTDNEITKALSFDGQFQSASQETIQAMVLGLVQFEVMYLSVISALHYAVEQCQREETESAKEYWDIGAALYVGSIEGPGLGGRSGGQLLYGVSKDLCPYFDTCDASNVDDANAMANAMIISALNIGKVDLSMNRCQAVSALLEDSILPSLQIPLIQGTLLYGSRLYSDNTTATSAEIDYMDRDIGMSHATSRSILPALHGANEQSATIVAHILSFQANRTYDDDDDIRMIFDSFRKALPAMGVQCIDVGMLSTVREELCTPEGTIEDTDTSVSSEGYSGIAWDVAEMTDSLLAGNRTAAEEIYNHGKNSFRTTPGGSSSLISLRSLSVDATVDMLDEPLFNMFLYSNISSMGGANARAFADSYVSAAFQSTTASSKSLLPAEAAVVLNLWMYVAHLLFESLTSCASSGFDGEKAATSLDVAAGFWNGAAAIGSPRKSSNLLYGIANHVAAHFSFLDDTSPRVNEQFVTLIGKAKKIVLDSGAICSVTAYVELRETVHAMLHQMTIPLVQGLIHYLRTNDKDRISLYATSLVPMVVACNPDDYSFLKTKLLDDIYEAIEMDEIVEGLYRSLDCLGISCDEIGIHFTDDKNPRSVSSQCHKVISTVAHAGFHAGNSFQKYSHLDFDLREMDILMRMEAFEAAEDIYRYGRHAKSSLALLANSSTLSQIPHFIAYARYFKSDVYADTLVGNALQGIGEGTSSLTDLQRRVLSLRFSQTLVLRQGALDIIFDSISDCNMGQNSSAQLEKKSFGSKGMDVNAWDEVAGLLVGSISRNGTILLSDHNIWYTPFDLAQRECIKFGVCIKGEIAPINQRMIELLYAGRAASSMASCAGIRKIGNELESLLLIPIIQALLSAAMEVFVDASPPLSNIELFVFSEAILPLIANINDEAATSLKILFEVDVLKPAPSVFHEIFGTMAQFYKSLDLDCDLIGSLGGMNACNNATINASDASDTGGLSSAWIVFGIVFSCLAVVVGAVFLFLSWRRKERRQKQPAGVAASRRETLSPEETEAHDPDDGSESNYSYNSDVDDERTAAPFVGKLGSTGETICSDRTPPQSLSPISRDRILQSFPMRSKPMSVEARKRISRINRYGDDMPFVDDMPSVDGMPLVDDLYNSSSV